jgi:hypothetical protein
MSATTPVSPVGSRERISTVFLSPPDSGTLNGLLGLLAKLYHLDSFRGSLMTRRVAVGLKYGAFVLTVILLFDIAAWGLFFNAIFHSTGDQLDFDGVTVLALFFAVLISIAIFVYEREFFCTDLTERKVLRKWFAVAGRVLIMLVAAYMTSRPVELLVFRGPIQRRTHEEQTLVEAVRLREQRRQQKTRTDELATERQNVDQEIQNSATGKRHGSLSEDLVSVKTDLVGETQRRNESERSMNAAARDAMTARNQAEAARSDENSFASRMRRLRERLDGMAADDPQREAVGQQLAQATRSRNRAAGRRAAAQSRASAAEAARQRHQTAFESAQQRISELSARQTVVSGELGTTTKQLEDLSQTRRGAVEIKRQSVEQSEADLREFMARVVGSGGAAPVVYKNYRYQLQPYDFFQQLRIIEDISAGRPARWLAPLDVKKDTVKELAVPYVFEDDRITVERLRAEGVLFSKIHWVTTAVAVLIPLLILLMKVLMPADLRVYYSNELQALGGQPEAQALHNLLRMYEREKEDVT